MNKSLKRVLKRALIKTVKPPLVKGAGLLQLLMTLEEEDENAQPPEFSTTGDYLVYWHKRIVREVEREFGHIRVGGSATARPHYAWGVLNGAYLARALGISRISVMEFGVAGGNGLVILEEIAKRTTEYFGVDIDVYGFDTGTGYQKPVDYRDVPNLFQEGGYPIDIEPLRKRLRGAQLMIGSVETTVPAFVQTAPAPVGFAAFDMSMYSATTKGLKLFDACEAFLLPRIWCYFGSSMGHTYSDFTADRLAISEFNAAHPTRKISPCYGLDVSVPNSSLWAGRIWLTHIFDHSKYGADDGLIKVRDNPLSV